MRDSYRGALTAKEIADGMNAAASNARRLATDASTLLTAGRFPTAASLACLSIEEAGKTSILRGFALESSEKELRELWRDYRNHTRKNVLWPALILFVDGARRLADFAKLFSKDAKHTFVLDQLKQSGFYTDFSANRSWSQPESAVDERLARSLVGLADIMAGRSDHNADEIELWVKHFHLVPRGDVAQMNQAAIGWYASMQKAGLYPEGPNMAEQFITVGLPGKEV